MNWIAEHLRIAPGASVLELGCGTGTLWRGRDALVSACSRLVLTDLSEGMLQKTRETLKAFSSIEYKAVDIRQIPFADRSFDVVIANMMLYHVPDLHQGLKEVRRVLKDGGTFCCATYGENGILENLCRLLGRPDLADQANHSFTLQNGAGHLLRHFGSVERFDYPDSLAVTDVNDLADYLYSLSGMADLRGLPREQVVSALEANMSGGVLRVPKEYGMFAAK